MEELYSIVYMVDGGCILLIGENICIFIGNHAQQFKELQWQELLCLPDVFGEKLVNRKEINFLMLLNS